MIKIVLLLQLITAVIKMSITDVNTDTKTDVEGKKKNYRQKDIFLLNLT